MRPKLEVILISGPAAIPPLGHLLSVPKQIDEPCANSLAISTPLMARPDPRGLKIDRFINILLIFLNVFELAVGLKICYLINYE